MPRIYRRRIPPDRLRTAEVAKVLGITTRRLLHWLEDGKVSEPARSPGGHRMWKPEEVEFIYKCMLQGEAWAKELEKEEREKA